ncbi:hypothetical protein BD310DRAFT_237030 [Dichomitus squalens]|uniref:Uncharacterized protein n=1 Tax=Dichomitus squalens TaxID=114155 RepID=A0A4Q9Q1Z2_9APHY|nr:hypothetical protein BD310DRAFT_237030 [Dichomitus squalens]
MLNHVNRAKHSVLIYARWDLYTSSSPLTTLSGCESYCCVQALPTATLGSATERYRRPREPSPEYTPRCPYWASSIESTIEDLHTIDMTRWTAPPLAKYSPNKARNRLQAVR